MYVEEESAGALFLRQQRRTLAKITITKAMMLPITTAERGGGVRCKGWRSAKSGEKLTGRKNAVAEHAGKSCLVGKIRTRGNGIITKNQKTARRVVAS